jgi:hypothetical protein
MHAARRLAVYTEIMQIDQAFDTYKGKYHSYPPNLLDDAEIKRHLHAAFPRWDESRFPVPPQYRQGGDPSRALVVWLTGFSNNPLNPFDENHREAPLFDFDESRLVFDGGVPIAYKPSGASQPYVYFHFATYRDVRHNQLRPYQRELEEGETNSTSDPVFVNPTSFQIISPGNDGDYGTGGKFPSGVGYTLGDNDNMTNFYRNTLGMAKE